MTEKRALCPVHEVEMSEITLTFSGEALYACRKCREKDKKCVYTSAELNLPENVRHSGMKPENSPKNKNKNRFPSSLWKILFRK